MVYLTGCLHHKEGAETRSLSVVLVSTDTRPSQGFFSWGVFQVFWAEEGCHDLSLWSRKCECRVCVCLCVLAVYMHDICISLRMSQAWEIGENN